MNALQRALRAGRSEWRAHVASALAAAVAFLCLSFALISSVNLKALENRWQHSGHLSVYLALDATEAQVLELRAALSRSKGVSGVQFVSSEQARAELLEGVGDSVLENLPTDAFPPSIEVTLSADTAADRGAAITSALSTLAAVESVETYDGWAKKIGRLVHAASVVVWLLGAIVLLTVAAVVASTTELALRRRQEEVEVLRFVGATRAYVRAPFLIEGALQGAAGAALALALSALVFTALRDIFSDQLLVLLGTPPVFMPWFASIALVACGACLGSVAAFSSLRKAFAS